MSSFVPAAGWSALTRAYDPVLAVTMREGLWRPVVASLAGGGVVVEVGAGTGSQSLELAGAGARVVAVDPDSSALAIAARKPGADAVDWREGMADALPVDSASADAVVMTLLLHHLDADGKRGALREAARVLRPGGRLCVADWGRPGGLAPRLGALVLRQVDGAAGVDDMLAGRLPAFVTGAGFAPPRRVGRLGTVWGTVELLVAARATRRASSS